MLWKITLVIALAAGTSTNGRWWYLGKANSPLADEYLDMQSLPHDYSVPFSVWIKFIPTSPKSPVRYQLSKWTVNCSYRSVGVDEDIAYYRSGKNVTSRRDENPEGVAPDSLGESLINFLCQTAPK